MQAIVLASGSQYRSVLLARLGLKFQTISANIDERAFEGEMPVSLSRRLGYEKALEAQKLLHESGENGCIIIASDQVAVCENRLLGKPGSAKAACEQLHAMAGKTVNFYTSVYMIDTASDKRFEAMDNTKARLRHLEANAIKRYVDTDKPLDCAGSFKVESLGISLFETIESRDPTALIGLPLISVCEGLRGLGIELP